MTWCTVGVMRSYSSISRFDISKKWGSVGGFVLHVAYIVCVEKMLGG